MSCRNQCIVLQTPLVDGSPCGMSSGFSPLDVAGTVLTPGTGYGGYCYNQTCAAGPWQDRFAALYTQNLQISIPVTIVVGLLVSSSAPVAPVGTCADAFRRSSLSWWLSFGAFSADAAAWAAGGRTRTKTPRVRIAVHPAEGAITLLCLLPRPRPCGRASTARACRPLRPRRPIRAL